MATLTSRNLDEALTDCRQPAPRAAAAQRLAEFRRRTAGRGTATAADLLQESRADRMAELTGTANG